jgi:hypothetical protein
MKVASVTVMAISQELIAGLAVVCTAEVLSDPESACVLTDQLLVYAVRLRFLRDAYAVRNGAKKYIYSNCRVTVSITISFMRSGSFHG